MSHNTKKTVRIIASYIIATIMLVLYPKITIGEYILIVIGSNCLFELWDINNKLSGNDTHRLIK